ncbi:hypothetical protein QYE76_066163 [Lolium multiflorum]|uniref:Uncharacterized protein n=1 Tax=Lolium multiflorum TaxID=4521 RepID=A0AAD8SBQ3_LOLMU|nr:hypothetical protein QYE76_066163 [Lolium multiflorum]
MSSFSSTSRSSWPQYGPVPLTRCPDCPRQEPLKRSICKTDENGNRGREFVACESLPYREGDKPAHAAAPVQAPVAANVAAAHRRAPSSPCRCFQRSSRRIGRRPVQSPVDWDPYEPVQYDAPENPYDTTIVDYEPEVESSDVDSDDESFHTKTRHVLRRLQSGQYDGPFARGIYKCPFCNRRLRDTDFNTLLNHVESIGRYGARVGRTVNVHAYMAKHKALGIHLRNLQASHTRHLEALNVPTALSMASEDVHMADLEATSTDWSSSDSDDSDIDELLNDDETEMMVLLFGLKQTEDRLKLLDQRKGSVMGRMCIPRNRALGHEQLMQDYFAEVPTYPPRLFRRRYRMRRSLFERIVKDCEANCDYFKQRRNAAQVMGFSPYQKISAAMRVIAYGIPADYTDEYLRIGVQTTTDCVRMFAKMVIKLYGEQYLRAPNEDDTKRLMEINEKRGWPGMLGSLDCMHWTWKNCPKAWHGMYCGKSRDATIVLEAVASQDLWIWHAFFGLPGTLNDINILNRSPLFARLVRGESPPCNYKVMNNEYTMGYYLTDGIYPNYATLVKSIKEKKDRALTRKEACFTKNQEACRKDIERAFGVLQARFAIVRGPARFWDKETLVDVMTCCVILHNMIIEDESGLNLPCFYDNVGTRVQPERNPDRIEAFLAAHRGIENAETHHQLTQDLIDHHWQLHGQ